MENRSHPAPPALQKKATSLRDLPVPINKEKNVEREQLVRIRKLQMQEEQMKQQQQQQAALMEEQHRKLQHKEQDDALVERVLSSMQEPSNINMKESQESKSISNEVKQSANEVQQADDSKSSSLSDKIVKELKEPIIIAGLAFLSNQTVVTDLLVKYIPKMIDSESKQINSIGFLIKGLLVGILFYIIKKYILK